MTHTDVVVYLLVDGEGESVVAHHTDRSEPYVDRLTVLVWVREEKVGLYRVFALWSLDGKAIVDLSQSPDHLATFKRASGVHLHVTSFYKLTEEVKSFLVLYWIPAFTYNVHDLIVSGTDQGSFAGYLTHLAQVIHVVHRLLGYRPIQACSFHHIICGNIVGNFRTKTVPWQITCISHLSNTVYHFNFVSHRSYLSVSMLWYEYILFQLKCTQLICIFCKLLVKILVVSWARVHFNIHVIRLGKLDIIVLMMNDKLRIFELLKDSFKNSSPCI